MDTKSTIVKAIDIDQWKHSWHNCLDNPDDLKRVEAILIEKIEGRIDDLIIIKEGLKATRLRMDLYRD